MPDGETRIPEPTTFEVTLSIPNKSDRSASPEERQLSTDIHIPGRYFERFESTESLAEAARAFVSEALQKIVNMGLPGTIDGRSVRSQVLKFLEKDVQGDWGKYDDYDELMKSMGKEPVNPHDFKKQDLTTGKTTTSIGKRFDLIKLNGMFPGEKVRVKDGPRKSTDSFTIIDITAKGLIYLEGRSEGFSPHALAV